MCILNDTATLTHPLAPAPKARGNWRSRGFTLIEVLIAIALMMAVVGTSFTFMNNLLNSRQRLVDEAARQRAATVLIDRLEAALLTCIAGDRVIGAGVAGDEHSISILARGVAASLADQGLRDSRLLGDLQHLEFQFDEPSQTIEARYSAVSIPQPQSVDRNAEGEGRAADRVEEQSWPLGSAAIVRFRYHDGSSWVDSFDSLQAGRLPAAVEVAIWFEPWPGTESLEGEDERASDRESEGIDDADIDERVFDEDAYSMESELELYFETPPPDRMRVIAILDPGPDEDDSVEFVEDEGEQE